MEKVTRIKVRGYHLDFYGHVNNARYLEFLEEARWDQYEKLFEYDYFAEKGLAFAVVNININYRQPAELGHVLEIKNRFKKFARKNAILVQEIFLEGCGTRIADAEVTFVLVDIRTGKAVEIDDEIRQVLSLR